MPMKSPQYHLPGSFLNLYSYDENHKKIPIKHKSSDEFILIPEMLTMPDPLITNNFNAEFNGNLRVSSDSDDFENIKNNDNQEEKQKFGLPRKETWPLEDSYSLTSLDDLKFGSHQQSTKPRESNILLNKLTQTNNSPLGDNALDKPQKFPTLYSTINSLAKRQTLQNSLHPNVVDDNSHGNLNLARPIVKNQAGIIRYHNNVPEMYSNKLDSHSNSPTFPSNTDFIYNTSELSTYPLSNKTSTLNGWKTSIPDTTMDIRPGNTTDYIQNKPKQSVRFSSALFPQSKQQVLAPVKTPSQSTGVKFPAISTQPQSILKPTAQQIQDERIHLYQLQIKELNQALASLKNAPDRNTDSIQDSSTMLKKDNIAQTNSQDKERTPDIYSDLNERCSNLEDVTRQQTSLIKSMNDLINHRENKHQKELDNLREDIKRKEEAFRIASMHPRGYYSDGIDDRRRRKHGRHKYPVHQGHSRRNSTEQYSRPPLPPTLPKLRHRVQQRNHKITDLNKNRASPNVDYDSDDESCEPTGSYPVSSETEDNQVQQKKPDHLPRPRRPPKSRAYQLTQLDEIQRKLEELKEITSHI